jgi:hypothetical protein
MCEVVALIDGNRETFIARTADPIQAARLVSRMCDDLGNTLLIVSVTRID